MRHKWVIGNWKMHGSRTETRQLLDAVRSGVSNSSAFTCVVCPPFLYIPEAADILAASPVHLGAQNLCAEDAQKGAYTGEVSAAMLQDFAVTYVLVGHSERRQYYGETDAVVAAKFALALESGLLPVLCVGESLAQRESGETLAVIAAQLNAVVEHCGIAALAKALVAYEPVWAIGTGKTATPEQAQEVHAFIRQHLASLDAQKAAAVPLLYGGSVNAGNAAALFAMQDIDGALIGGASLKADEFNAICKIAE